MGKLQLKTELRDKREYILNAAVRKVKNKSGVIEMRPLTCPECSEEFCNGNINTIQCKFKLFNITLFVLYILRPQLWRFQLWSVHPCSSKASSQAENRAHATGGSRPFGWRRPEAGTWKTRWSQRCKNIWQQKTQSQQKSGQKNTSQIVNAVLKSKRRISQRCHRRCSDVQTKYILKSNSNTFLA